MKEKNELLFNELNEENLESMIYEIRGERVMFDFDLARIYGYTTRKLNEQVKNNIKKFPEDFMFQLTRQELDQILRSKKSTANELSSKRRYNPYAFTEKGIYMLMTVLRGELATKQSITLIRLFEKMKNYIVSSNNLTTVNELLKLANQVNENTKSIERLNQVNDDAKKKLEVVMNYFVDPSTYKPFIILNGQRAESDHAYQTIFSSAKSTIDIIDDYINERTLYLLLGVNKDIRITIYSDNVSRNPLKEEYIDYFKSQSGLNITIKPTNNLYHDRYIVIDYSFSDKKIFISGPSLKDAGNRIAVIYETEDTKKYEKILDSLLTL
ncbi:MAG: ORF6N domain-containing protein [Bacilli bacterium]|nr:ORF6N domain-containing protein [Bacilli bacterium]